jgi:hypothetical protein
MGGYITSWVFAKGFSRGMGRFIRAILFENKTKDSWSSDWKQAMEWDQ